MSPNHTIAQEKFVEILQRILSNFYQSVGMGSTKSKVQTGTNQNCDEQIGGSEAHSDTAHTRTPHPTPATHKMMQLERQCFLAMDRPAQKSRSNRRNQTTKPRRDWDWSEIGEGFRREIRRHWSLAQLLLISQSESRVNVGRVRPNWPVNKNSRQPIKPDDC